jgi:hypothetical protein
MTQRTPRFALIGLRGVTALLFVLFKFLLVSADSQIIYRPVGPEFDGSNLYYMILGRSLIGHTHDVGDFTSGVIRVEFYNAYSNLAWYGNIGTGMYQVAAGEHGHDLSDMTGTLDVDRYDAYSNLYMSDSIGTGVTQVAAGDHLHNDYALRMDGIDENVTAVSNIAANEIVRAVAAEGGLLGYINSHVASNFLDHSSMIGSIGALEDRSNAWNEVVVSFAGVSNRVDALDIATGVLHVAFIIATNRIGVLETNTAPLQSFIDSSNKTEVILTNYYPYPLATLLSNAVFVLQGQTDIWNQAVVDAVTATGAVATLQTTFTAHTNNESADIQHLTAAEKLLATNNIQGATIVTGAVASVETNAGILAFTVPSGGAGTITNILSTDSSVVVADAGGPQPDLSVTAHVATAVSGKLDSNVWAAADSTTNYASLLSFTSLSNAAITGGTVTADSEDSFTVADQNVTIKWNTNAAYIPHGTTDATSYRGDWGAAVSNRVDGLTTTQAAHTIQITNLIREVSEGPLLTNAAYVAIGKNANAVSGTAVGSGAYGGADGAAFGRNCRGGEGGVAAGYLANSDTYGVSVGYGSSGTNLGTSVGANAKSDNGGVAIGYNSWAYGGFGDYGVSSFDSVAIGSEVSNAVPNSTLVKGTLYVTNGITLTGGNFDGGGGSVTGVTDVIGSGQVYGKNTAWALRLSGATQRVDHAVTSNVLFNTVVVSNGNVTFNLSTGRVTVNQKGMVVLSCGSIWNGVSVSANTEITHWLKKNGSLVQPGATILVLQSGAFSLKWGGVSCVSYSDGNDYFEYSIQNYTGNTMTNSSTESWFCGVVAATY